jgi:hypothetical protein
LKKPQHMLSPPKGAQARRECKNVMCNGNIGAGLRSHNLKDAKQLNKK